MSTARSAPLIGIVCGPRYENGILYYGLSPAYSNAVVMAGGLPVLITPNVDASTLRGIYERLDGVLIAGGGDVDPARYGMSDNTQAYGIYGVHQDRDSAEINLICWAYADNKPLFGICRGCQVANVALGGTLYRDIPQEYPGYTGLNHSLSGVRPRDYLAHGISVKPGTRVAQALGPMHDGLKVNSLHHQAIREVAAPFTISATAEDGIIEALEIPDARFFIGVQWHPEELAANHEPMRRLFETFITAARK